LIGVVAIFRGEPDNALKAFERGSLGFFARQGLADDFFRAFERVGEGASPRLVLEEFDEAAANAFPGKLVTAAIAAALGSEPRTGLGKVIPGGFGRPRIDPLTGGPLRNQRVISLGLPTGPAFQTDIPAPAAFGSRLTERKLNAIEQLFADAEVKTFFPSPSGIINPATRQQFERVADTPVEVIDAFRQEVGKQRGVILGRRFKTKDQIDRFARLPLEARQRILRRIKAIASKRARIIINRALLGRRGGATIAERLAAQGLTIQ